MHVIRPTSPRYRFTVISTSCSNAEGMRSSFSTEISLKCPRGSSDKPGWFIEQLCGFDLDGLSLRRQALELNNRHAL